MKKIFLLIIIFGIFIFSSCKDSTRAQWKALGKHHIMTLYTTDGHIIKTWESSGNVSNEQNSDGWYFEDISTGKLVEITGTIIIEVK